MSLALPSKKGELAQPAKAKAASQSASSGLMIGEAKDAFEQEAERIAEEVMAGGAMVRPQWSLSSMNIGTPLQRRAMSTANPAKVPSIVHEVLRSPGQPLEPTARAFFEPRFGHDFGKVRVHTDGKAAESARAVSAVAYTVGNDVVLGTGHHNLRSAETQRLLAHELAHAVQQSRGGQPPLLGHLRSLEEDAERAAAQFGSGRRLVPVRESSAPGLARQTGAGTPSGGTAPSAGPPWLSGVKIVKHVQGNIYDINVTGYGPAEVGPFRELQDYLAAQGRSKAEQAHHIVGREHLADVSTPYNDANAPSVALENGTHNVISTRITSEQKVLGGRRGGRPGVTKGEIAELYQNVYTQDTPFKELSTIADNILGVGGTGPTAKLGTKAGTSFGAIPKTAVAHEGGQSKSHHRRQEA